MYAGQQQPIPHRNRGIKTGEGCITGRNNCCVQMAQGSEEEDSLPAGTGRQPGMHLLSTEVFINTSVDIVMLLTGYIDSVYGTGKPRAGFS